MTILFPTISVAAEQGDKIVNSAWLTSNEITSSADDVTVTAVLRTPSTIEFLNHVPLATANGEQVPMSTTGHSLSGSESGPYTMLPVPAPFGDTTPFDLSEPLTLHPTEIFHIGEPIFIRTTDEDQNLDNTTAETIIVTLSSADTGDKEILLLSETGPDTGIFTGYISSNNDTADSNDGALSLVENGTLTANYRDGQDGSDVSTNAALVDPYGIVFDSLTGLPVNGATVTLINVVAGQPASVFGDDGISSYPASVISGEVVFDSSGRAYAPVDGGFRFPLIAPGTYRLEIEPPTGYVAPSGTSTASIQNLPGAPFAIETGSRGEVFVVNPGPAVHIDIPVDPVNTDLWIQKEANKTQAAIGDFIGYRIHVENSNQDEVATGVSITDRLPLGFRYQEGSTRIDDAAVADPTISADGRTLTFTLADLPPETGIELTYVAEVGAGTKPGDSKNVATASGQGNLTSNTASAVVTIREELLRSSSLLMGRVMIGSCDQPDTELAGLKNARIFLEDGTYVVTDDEGKYHFEGLEPGTHVVQLDLASLSETYRAISCEDNNQFSGRNFSQFVDIRGGTMWRADFHVELKEKRRGDVSIELNGALDNDIVTFQIPVRISQVPLKDLRLSVLLPEGLDYVPGSSRLNDALITDPSVQDSTLSYLLGDKPAEWEGLITLQARVADTHPAELPTSAVLNFNSPDQNGQQTPKVDNLIKVKKIAAPVMAMKFDVRPHYPTRVAEFSAEDKAFFDQLVDQLRGYEIDKLFAIGHTDNVRIAPENRIYFADNFELSAARARNVAEYLGKALNLPPEKVVSIGIADAAPVADNSTPEGRSLNRRVELRVEGKQIDSKSILDLVKAHSGLQKVETVGLRPGETSKPESSDLLKKAETKQEQPQGILYPFENEKLANRIVSVRINLDSGLKPRLTLDGQVISEERVGFKMADQKTGKTLYTYIGIDFGGKGSHKLKLEGLGPFGNARYQQEIEVIRTGEIAEIKQIAADENIADGLTPITIRLQLLDSNGQVVNAATRLTLLDGNLLPELDETEFIGTRKLNDFVEVDAQGYVRFQPTQQSGLYHATLGFDDKTIEIETYVKPSMREWILVGFAEGTLGYNTLSGNKVDLKDTDIEDHFYQDERIKFFAKGAIKGEWLLTMAYDSKKRNLDGDSLQQIIDPDAYYPLYGDETDQRYEAASARKIYVKLERNQFYALFGDMQTDLTQTELSRYSRSMNGLKSELQNNNFEFNLYAADTRQGFVKDEIRSDGTSGRYYLSQNDLVLNSEEITIETRDRLQSEKIIDSQQLQRHIDYDIDYTDGSLFFKRPISSKDESFNPIFIIARYETEASEKSEINYGGRAAVKALDQQIEIGATHIHEKSGTSEGNLYGVDATLKLNSNNTLRLEAASTDTEEVALDESGEAFLAEFEHNSQNIQANVYYREQDEEFGLGQQNGSESGTRKYGAEGTYRINQETSVSALAYHEDNLESDSERDVAELTVDIETDRYGIHGGIREARDTLGSGSEHQSRQLLTGADWTSADRKLTLRATHEQSLGSDNDNSSYPTVTMLGADYRLTKQVSLFAEQEFTWGETKETEGTRAGLKATPWAGGDAQTSVERQIDENGERVFALFGLGQTWRVTDNWSVDGSLDRSYTIKDSNSYDFDLDVPAAHGSDEDFTAISLGATYQQEEWSWENRVELRHADNQDKYGIISSLIGQVDRGTSASARFSGFLTDGNGSKSSDQTLTLGLAYRPLESRWIILNRLDAKFDRNETVDQDDKSWRLINNLHANYKLNRDWQIAPYYGLKYVRQNFDGLHYDGFTDLLALETRYNVNKRWDFGLHGSVLHSWNNDQFDYSSGASVGYLFMTNLWASLGYNFNGFRDEDFSQSNYTAKGAYLKFRFKFDQQTTTEALNWLNAQ